MRGDLTETFEIMKLLIMGNIFLISIIKLEIYSQDKIKKKKSTNQVDFFLLIHSFFLRTENWFFWFLYKFHIQRY